MCMFRKESNHQIAVAVTYEEEKGKQMMIRVGLEKIFFCTDDNLVKSLCSVCSYWLACDEVCQCVCVCVCVCLLIG